MNNLNGTKRAFEDIDVFLVNNASIYVRMITEIARNYWTYYVYYIP